MLKSFRNSSFVLVLFGTVILAGSFSCIAAAATSRAYKSTQPLAPGSMVSLDTTQDGYVVAAKPDNATKLVGVVVPINSATLQFNQPGADNQIAQSGEAPVLVSDLNGAVKAGDHITVSAVEGVGMKATVTGMSVGVAQTDFSQVGATTQSITDKSGRSHEIHIAQIKVMLGVGQYTVAQPASYIPSQLQAFADALSGGPTAAWRVLSSSVIILVTLIVIGVIINASIRSSLISIGRNPLSSPAISSSLFQLAVITVGLLFMALLASYLVLTR